jgi:hypothetical protein
MPPLIKSRFRLLWYVTTVGITIASLLPGLSLHDPRIVGSIDSNWIHFLAYVFVAVLPVLGWRIRAGLLISFSTAILSVVLQVLHGDVTSRGVDKHGMMVNLLGIASGTLLGLNVLALGTHSKQLTASDADRSRPTLR